MLCNKEVRKFLHSMTDKSLVLNLFFGKPYVEKNREMANNKEIYNRQP
jgi:hypothetical protein